MEADASSHSRTCGVGSPDGRAGMIGAMWHAMSAGMLAVVLATQTIQTACPKDNPSTPPTGDVLTTRDGVGFRVETVLTGLEVPWSLTFAPDGRLFVTERPGRVRIATPGQRLRARADARRRLHARRSRPARSRARSRVLAESIRVSLLLGNRVRRRRQSHRPVSRGQLATGRTRRAAR